jgi:gamma-D-glutamyl-L-lysine dipeptidyl-peptidase
MFLSQLFKRQRIVWILCGFFVVFVLMGYGLYRWVLISESQGLVNQPVVDMFAEPLSQTERVSQTIYGERVEILKKSTAWLLITTSDHYRGWVNRKSISSFISSWYYSSHRAKIHHLFAHVYRSPLKFKNVPLLTLGFNVVLPMVDFERDQNTSWIEVKLLDGQTGWVQRGDVDIDASIISLPAVLKLSEQFLGLPYTWGGRASCGFDCSGFIQTLFEQLGIVLPRDASQQKDWIGFDDVSLQDRKSGDVLFFGSPSQHTISHVGMYLSDGKFIHATMHETPKIKMDRLDDAYWKSHYVSAKRLKSIYRNKLYLLKNSQQLVLVVSNDWSSSQGQLFLFHKEEESWHLDKGPMEVKLGKAGMAWDPSFRLDNDETIPVKREGDHKNPAGIFSLSSLFGFTDPLRVKKELKMPYRFLAPDTFCVEDARSVFYNQIVSEDRITHKDWLSGEHMYSFPEYQWGVVVDYNRGHDKKPLFGSCIFIHLRADLKKATEGCTALLVFDLEYFIRWLDISKKPVLVQLPLSEYCKYYRFWGLPMVLIENSKLRIKGNNIYN